MFMFILSIFPDLWTHQGDIIAITTRFGYLCSDLALLGLLIPMTYWAVNFLKPKENEGYYEILTKLTPLRVKVEIRPLRL